ncbi:DUF6460 domain-containing protein [Geminicoccaceae bacterium 1502E]|nr:DUF6460 domain-containing protein [Geminicoccaceae bacterium 1502E]
MARIDFRTVIKLLIWSLVVGAVLAFFDISPQQILGWVVDQAREFVGNVETYIGRAVTYILLGAVVVVPVWLISWLLKSKKG